ncbi:GAF domain-containing protein [Methyloversatilis thermotolerans]|uniref:GAF domain-containing protein n=1 Tax=Methyloversatilis thermotolerans TaxID=1346290 RepID=UPI00039FD589|nr:helix-turn-helix domain-containing protein [Methyloversatilis thermotolerans]
MKGSVTSLAERRRRIESIRRGDGSPDERKVVVGMDIAGSWQRSREAVPETRSAAPLDQCANDWSQTPYGRAVASCVDELETVARESGMVAAVSDAEGRLLWTGCSRSMRTRAERVHFVPGGRWDERSVGTNALALALRYRRPSSVFSAEHFIPAVQDWVCYAAPVRDAGSGEVMGVVDLSTTWNRHSPLALHAVERFAHRVSQALQSLNTVPVLRLRMLGTPQATLQGRPLPLSPRQLEILCLLALHPEGLDLERLHAALYGDRPVSLATLKTEVSQLRERLGGAIGSRPYRLLVNWQADFRDLEQALDAGRIESALACYRGAFLPRTESPLLRAWRDCLESRLSDAIFHVNDPDLLLNHLGQYPEAVDALQRLGELLPSDHPGHHLLARTFGDI